MKVNSLVNVLSPKQRQECNPFSEGTSWFKLEMLNQLMLLLKHFSLNPISNFVIKNNVELYPFQEIMYK